MSVRTSEWSFGMAWQIADCATSMASWHDIGREPQQYDRERFNRTMAQWKHDNTHLVGQVPDGTTEALWKQLSVSDVPIHRTETAVFRPQPGRRAQASEAEIAAARLLVSRTVEEASLRNVYLSQNPRRNQYMRGPAAARAPPTASSRRDKRAAPFVLSQEARRAAALVAELDAQELVRSGAAPVEYKIAFKDPADSGEIQYKTVRPPSVANAPIVGRDDAAAGYWLADWGARYPGSNPFGGASNNGCKVFRNVKDFGARGDGVTDDTEAVNRAISDGGRCGANCGASTVKGATVYFPPGTCHGTIITGNAMY